MIAGAWWLLLRSYRDLSKAKWDVIEKMEKQLPLQPFADEWMSLKQDSVKWWRPRYAEQGLVERLVPIVFALLFVAAMLSS